MDFYVFRLFSPEMQVRHILMHGTCLAQCCKDTGCVDLYYLPDERRGFFAEVRVADGQGQAVVVRSCRDSGLLEEYAQGVQLPT